MGSQFNLDLTLNSRSEKNKHTYVITRNDAMGSEVIDTPTFPSSMVDYLFRSEVNLANVM